ncbi:tetratricopeptide repeat protein [Actinacidiphila alni]|uniref:tetratricopeptide repeat protein n=1 Tax=Actinacidiphila alni TaxID=380248 RepID=UPI00340975C0
MSIEELRRALEARVREHGEDDVRTLVAHRELADACVREGEHVEALAQLELVLTGAVGLLGADHRTTVGTLANVAHVWFAGWAADRRPELAVPLSEFAVSELIRVAGADDPGTLSARSDLATAYAAAGRIDRALAECEDTHADCVRVLGERHALTRVVRDNAESLARAAATAGGAEREGAAARAARARELAASFSDTLGLDALAVGGWVSVALPALGERIGVPVREVKRVTRSRTPTGDAALELVMRDGDDAGGVRPLIVLADDVVFAPEEPAAVLRSPIPVSIADAPTLMSYRDTIAHAERFALAAAAPGGAGGGTVAGTALLSRCAIAGAVRFGLRPLPAVAWWLTGWRAGGEDWGLPPFPKDPVWDHLVRSAAGLRPEPSPAPARTDERAAVRALTVRDVAALGERLGVPRLDEEFVATWRRLMPITPARFADLLLAGLPAARADVALYPDGAGSAELVLRDGAELRALLQLRFDLRSRELTIDEVRISEDERGRGLFQRLEYNTEELAVALGMKGVHVLATGAGTLAFPRAGFPKDPELYARAHRIGGQRPGGRNDGGPGARPDRGTRR